MEPEVQEVPRLFRSVLNEFVDEAGANEDAQDTVVEKQQRSKSISFDVFRTKLQRQLFKGTGLRGSRGNLQQELDWSDEEDGEREEEVIKARARKGRSRSMPEIGPVEQSAQAWGKVGRVANDRITDRDSVCEPTLIQQQLIPEAQKIISVTEFKAKCKTLYRTKQM